MMGEWRRQIRDPDLPFLIAVTLVAVALVPIRARQQEQAPRPTFRGGADVIPLDVTVLDHNRRPVRGLTAADFRVAVDGEERPVVAFEAVEMPDRVRTGASWLRDVPSDVSTNGFVPDRVVVLLFDDWNTGYASVTEATSAMPPPFLVANAIASRKIGHAVVDELRPTDLAGIAYVFQTQTGVDFTTDRVRLRAAVDRFNPSRPSNLPGVSGACQHNSCTLGALRGVATALRAWPDRRKLLIYISPEGAFLKGPQNVEENASEANQAGVDMTPALTDTLRELQRANVTVYQFDPRGIEEVLDGSVNPAASGVGMFADATGGWTSTRSNEPWWRAPEVFVENDSYYMLGISPSSRRAANGFHPLRVTVNRQGLTVGARNGYYDASADREQPAEVARMPLDDAMIGPAPLANLPLRLSVAAFRVAGAREAAIAVTGGIDRTVDLAGGERIDVAVRAFDERSQTRASKGVWTSHLSLRPQVSLFGAVHYDTLSRIDLPPGAYEIRLSMQRASDKIAGGVAASIVVPKFDTDALSGSGIVLGRAGESAILPGQPLSDVLPFPPTTRRVFDAHDPIAAMLRLYQGGKDSPGPVTVSTRIVDATDRIVFEATSALAPAMFVGAARAAEFQFRLPLSKLGRGEYLLTIDAALDKRTVRATPVRFRVHGG